MSAKRMIGIDPTNIIDGARSKRRRGQDEEVTSPESMVDIEMEDDMPNEDTAQVKENGLQILRVLKAAKSKEGYPLAHEFWRLPQRRQWPDYYIVIKRPVSLDDIEANLNAERYLSLSEVKEDFNQCFKNAKKYNQKGSNIWNDAKALQKLTAREYETLTGIDDDDYSGDEDDDRPRKKHQSLSKVLKNRLHKLIEKTDDSGRVVSIDFMEPPDRKLYPEYYQVIKNVMCFNFVLKKVKRKEYQSSSEFAADVQLIFDNAFTFNRDHSPIWEDAMALKEYFTKLMSALPEEYALPAPSQSLGKIKLRLNPGLAKKANAETSSASVPPLTLKLPASRPTVTEPPPTIKVPAPAESARKSASTATTTQPPATVAPTLPSGASITHSSHHVANEVPSKEAGPSRLHHPPPAVIPNGISQAAAVLSQVPQQVATSHTVTPAPSQSAPVQSQVHLPSPPASIPPPRFPLQSIKVRTTPKGRVLHLDRSECVKAWSLRLGSGERGIRISEVQFVNQDEDSTATGDDSEEEAGKRRVAITRERLRSGKDKEKEKESKAAQKEKPEVLVRLNNVVIKATSGAKGQHDEWVTDLLVGPNVVEVMGDKGGDPWRLYLERQTGT